MMDKFSAENGGAGEKRGILPDSSIKALLRAGAVSAAPAVADDQIQPASLDLRLGGKAWRLRASFLPGAGKTVAEKLRQVTLHEIDIENGAVLETGCVYLCPLLENLALPADIAAAANPKSSTGRLDIFTRIIADGAREFDKIPAGYHGALYLEISPRSFPILVRRGSRLSQMRFRFGTALLDSAALRALQAGEKLVSDIEADIGGNGLALSVDLAGDAFASAALGRRLVGYRGKRHSGLIDVDKHAACAIEDFWEPIYTAPSVSCGAAADNLPSVSCGAAADNLPSVSCGAAAGSAPSLGSGQLVLDPNEFYILASREAVRVPPLYAAEMTPFDPLVGEFRVHYAGFFDPGFGAAAAGGAGARAVLEVRSHEVPFILEHGQIIGRLVYEHMLAAPEKLYGAGLHSHYQGQGLKLSKHFK